MYDAVFEEQLAVELDQRAQLQVDGAKAGALDDGQRVVAADEFGGDGQEDLVDQAGVEERRVERRAALAQDAADAAPSQVAQACVDARDVADLDSRRFDVQPAGQTLCK